jgi:hypothetical protein
MAVLRKVTPHAFSMLGLFSGFNTMSKSKIWGLYGSDHSECGSLPCDMWLCCHPTYFDTPDTYSMFIPVHVHVSQKNTFWICGFVCHFYGLRLCSYVLSVRCLLKCRHVSFQALPVNAVVEIHVKTMVAVKKMRWGIIFVSAKADLQVIHLFCTWWNEHSICSMKVLEAVFSPRAVHVRFVF